MDEDKRQDENLSAIDASNLDTAEYKAQSLDLSKAVRVMETVLKNADPAWMMVKKSDPFIDIKRLRGMILTQLKGSGPTGVVTLLSQGAGGDKGDMRRSCKNMIHVIVFGLASAADQKELVDWIDAGADEAQMPKGWSSKQALSFSDYYGTERFTANMAWMAWVIAGATSTEPFRTS